MLTAKFWLNICLRLRRILMKSLRFYQVSAEEAIAAIQRLRLYGEQQMEGSPAFIREMERHEHIVWRRKLDLQN